MIFSKSHRSNLWFLLVVTILVIPQTRKPIQVFLQKGLALFSPSVIDEADRNRLDDYQWELVDLNGETYNFENSKGKVIVLNFWATWCPPCIAELPSMQALYKNYHGRVEFLFVSNESAITIQEFLAKKHYQIPVYQALSSPPVPIEVSNIPRTLLIDKCGTIVIDKTGASNWNSEKVKNTIDMLLEL